MPKAPALFLAALLGLTPALSWAVPLDETAVLLPEDLGQGLRRSVTSLRKGSRVLTECYKDMLGSNSSREGPLWPHATVPLLYDSSNLQVDDRKRKAALKAVRAAVRTWSSKVRAFPRFHIIDAEAPLAVPWKGEGPNTLSWQELSASPDLVGVINLVTNARRRIVRFDIVLNQAASWDVLVSTWNNPGTLEGPYDIQNALANAFAQALGLGALEGSENCGMVMNPVVFPNQTTKREPGDGDLTGMRRLYNKRARALTSPDVTLLE